MLAVARSLMTNPDLLIMDEPSEGLAPRVIKQIGDVITQLKGKLTVFLAEQNFNMAISVADYVYIVSNGIDRLRVEARGAEGQRRGQAVVPRRLSTDATC